MRNSKIFFKHNLTFSLIYIIDILVDIYLTRKAIKLAKHKLICYSHDKISTAINLNGVYEKRDLDILMNFLDFYKIHTSHQILLDVGANIGNHSIYFQKYFEKVLSFEPFNTTYEILKLNTNKFNKIEAFNFGLSNMDSELNMNINPVNMGGSKISTNDNNGDTKFKFYSLDSLNLIQSIGMIKIDVEGHEIEVLLGAEKTIQKHQPIILFELNKLDFSEDSPTAYSILQRYGYKKFFVIERSCKISTKSKLFNSLFSFLFSRSVNVNLLNGTKVSDYPFIIAMPEKYDSNFFNKA